MKAEPHWIGKKALLLLQDLSLAKFGGARGLRDEGLLDAALARPRVMSELP
jgi:death-on-curing protein